MVMEISVFKIKEPKQKIQILRSEVVRMTFDDIKVKTGIHDRVIHTTVTPNTTKRITVRHIRLLITIFLIQTEDKADLTSLALILRNLDITIRDFLADRQTL